MRPRSSAMPVGGSAVGDWAQMTRNQIPTSNPAVKQGNRAVATRRVGGDQNASALLRAWRRISTNAPASPTKATPHQ